MPVPDGSLDRLCRCWGLGCGGGRRPGLAQRQDGHVAACLEPVSCGRAGLGLVARDQGIAAGLGAGRGTLGLAACATPERAWEWRFCNRYGLGFHALRTSLLSFAGGRPVRRARRRGVGHGPVCAGRQCVLAAGALALALAAAEGQRLASGLGHPPGGLVPVCAGGLVFVVGHRSSGGRLVPVIRPMLTLSVPLESGLRWDAPEK